MAKRPGQGDVLALEQCCARCGYRSANASFFARQKTELLSRRETFCAACQAAGATAIKGAGRQLLFLALSIGSVWLLVHACTAPDATVPIDERHWVQEAVVVGALLSLLVSPALHELGHAVFGRLARLRVPIVRIGTGPVLKSFEWKKTRVEWRLFFFAGGQTMLHPEGAALTRGKHALSLLGGPLAHVALAGFAIVVIATSEKAAVTAAALGFLVVQAFYLVGNLVPKRTNDGAGLLRLLREKVATMNGLDRSAAARQVLHAARQLMNAGRHAEAARLCEAALRDHPGATAVPFVTHLLHSLMKGEGPRAALQYYLARKNELPPDKDLPRGALAGVHANAAWSAVLTGDRSFAALAEDLSKKAFDAVPHAPEMQGTRGAVLVEQGETEKGVALLIDAVRNIRDQEDDCAHFVAFWAKGERARGNFDMAEELERYRGYLLERIAGRSVLAT